MTLVIYECRGRYFVSLYASIPPPGKFVRRGLVETLAQSPDESEDELIQRGRELATKRGIRDLNNLEELGLG